MRSAGRGLVAAAALLALAAAGGCSSQRAGPAVEAAKARTVRPPAPRPVPIAHMPRAGLLLDVRTGERLWARRPDARLRIASLTKIMTALIVASRTREEEEAEIVPAALHVGGSRVGHLPAGGELPVGTLLYGMLLPSGNDAANELAVHVAGSIPAFVALMNARARRYGLHCTHYSSPSGFVNQRNYSCAGDLALLAQRLLRSRRLARVVRTREITLGFPDADGEITFANSNPLLAYRYPGTIGVKTGFTTEAGDCLVAAASRGGVTLMAVLLHSPAPGGQARNLFDWAFTRIYHQRPVRSRPLPPHV